MTRFKLLLAQDEINEVLNRWKLDATTRTGLIIVAAAGTVAVLVLAWAIFIRKPAHRPGALTEDPVRRRRSRREHREPNEQQSEESSGAEGAPAESRRRKRRRRREHRPRNPTLAETGGLPPPRDDGSQQPRLF
jgi:hypothetical protein